MRFLILFPILVLLSLAGGETIVAQEANSVFSSANKDFSEGNYDQAALKYESLVEKGLLSSDLFYNLGTTYFRLDEPGKSMLALRRAQFLEPSLPEAKQNIKVLRNQLGFLEFAESRTDQFLRLLPRNFGVLTAATFVWTALIAFTAGFTIAGLTRFRPALVTLAVLFFLLAIVTWRMEEYRSTHLATETFSIVITGGAKALTSPTPGAQPVIDLPPGSEVRIVQSTGPWCYIDIPGSLRGWVRGEEVEPIWPIPGNS